jgi:hypothetical protein
VLGLSAGRVGVGLSVGGVVGLLGSVPVGIVADRLRTGSVYIGLQVLRGLAFTGFCLVHGFGPFVAVCACTGLTEAALPPVGQAVVGATVPAEDRVDTLAKVRALRNLGFGLGALVATAAIGSGANRALLALVATNAASYFVVAGLLARAGVAAVAVPVDGARAVSWRFTPDRRYLLATGLSGVLAVHSTLLVVALPLWFAGHTPVPRALIGVLVAVNTAMAVLLQARFAAPCRTVPGAARGAVLAGAALAGFAGLCLLAHVAGPALAVLVALAAVVLLTCGELWQSASGWTLSYELADPNRRTAHLAVFQLGGSVQAALAPLLITNLLLPSPLGWPVFAVLVLTAGLLTPLVVRAGARAR